MRKARVISFLNNKDFRRWALGTVFACFLLVVIEIGFRVMHISAPAASTSQLTTASTPSPFEDDGKLVRTKKDFVSDGNMYSYVAGEKAGLYYILPKFRDFSFERKKDKDTYRIFVLGDSTPFGLYLDESQSFPRLLEQRLNVNQDEKFEVINVSMPGLNSSHVRDLANLILPYDPDMVILYVGNNEMLFTDISSTTIYLSITNAWLLDNFSIAQWLNYFFMSVRYVSSKSSPVEDEPRQMTHAIVLATTLTERVQASISGFVVTDAAKRLEENLDAITHSLKDSGIEVLIIMPLTNLTWPPLGSAFPEGFSEGERFLRLLDEAKQDFAFGENEIAYVKLLQSVREAPEFAEANYYLGMVSKVLNKDTEAGTYLRRARDMDTWTHRSVSLFEKVTEGVAQRQNVPFLDLRDIFLRRSVSTSTLFIDHLHPTPEGHDVIAKSLSQIVYYLMHNENPAQ